MRFEQTTIPGVFVIHLQVHSDDRGFFARSFCRNELGAQGLNPEVVQVNSSLTHRAGTFRGFHYQQAPAAEAKIVRCTKGAIFDVAIDLRRDSSTYLQSFGVELSADNRKALYVPEMFAHGYLALTDGAEASYSVSQYYSPEHERGIRFDDPLLNVDWPIEVSIVSEKDASWPDFEAD